MGLAKALCRNKPEPPRSFRKLFPPPFLPHLLSASLPSVPTSSLPALLQALFMLLWAANELQARLNQGCPSRVNSSCVALPQPFLFVWPDVFLRSSPSSAHHTQGRGISQHESTPKRFEQEELCAAWKKLQAAADAKFFSSLCGQNWNLTCCCSFLIPPV